MLDIFTQAEILSTYPFIEGRRDWPEGAIYRYDRTGHEILRIVRGISDDLALSTVHGEVGLALIIDGPLVVMCSRVGEALPWAGASFHWHRVRHSERILPTSAIDTLKGSKIDLMLLDGNGGRVRAARSLTLPTDFTRMLNEAILEQSRFRYDPIEERRMMDALLRRSPTPASLAARACIKATLAF
jgi:hypothetical protein